MTRLHLRFALALALLAVGARRVDAQASPYVPLDDPMLPLLEQLIARGDVRDPSPMVRPFRRSDAQRVLAAADTTLETVRELRAWYADVPDPTPGDSAFRFRGQVIGRAGFQAATQARRDLLHPAGDGSVWPWADVRFEATWGPVALVARPGIENRVQDDPDWPGRRDNLFSGRLFEGYASVQAGPARLMFGQLERNWGPTGLPGFPISNVSYRRDGLAIEFDTRTVQFSSYASQLADMTDSTGALVKRYYLTKRLGVRLSDRLTLGAWESTVLQGVGRSFESAYLNPLSLIYLVGTYGYGDAGVNNMIGLDVTWRSGRHTVLGQFALDDFWYDNRERNRDRFGLTAAATGPLGRRASYRATYSMVSAFALRTFVSEEAFVDDGVGLGRNFSDNDQFTLQASVPITSRWLISPELTYFRQGEGRITDPYPVLPLDRARFPTVFLGTVERTLRAAVAVSGRQGPLQLFANAGVHRISNLENVAGASKTRIEARVQASLAIGRSGWLR
jgi:hypothetical protein